jgi:curved DNA-binding protein CbpA
MTTAECLRLLGVSGKPTKVAIKKAFRLAVLRYHPDTKGSDKEFIRLRTAYDKLMALKSDELARVTLAETPCSVGYDPFLDVSYHHRRFFEPENRATEGFERSLRARGCPICHGMGYITKNTNPTKGFMGRERRYCKCQWA